MRPRAAFVGTPAFAVPALEALVELAEVALVVCQPDKPVGRSQEVQAPAVKVRALELGLPVSQPTKLKDGTVAAQLRDLHLDVAVVAAYGRILPPDVLAAPRLGCVNVHASLLPRYRGAAPITWAIVRGEARTGVTLMQMDAGLDTGPMLEQFAVPIGETETAGELTLRLAQLGGEAVRVGLPKLLAGAYSPVPQDDSVATFAPILTKDDGRIPWTAAAKAVHDHVRGMSPWPGAFTRHKGKLLKLHTTRVAEGSYASAAPGTVVFADRKHAVVACGDGALELVVVQPEGKRAMRVVEWLAGRGVAEGDVLSA